MTRHCGAAEKTVGASPVAARYGYVGRDERAGTTRAESKRLGKWLPAKRVLGHEGDGWLGCP